MYFDSDRRRITLDGIETRRDYFEIDNVTYQALPLDDYESKKGLGINSSVFSARTEDEGEATIIKVCNYGEGFLHEKPLARRNRFEREISAMQLALATGRDNLVVRIKGEGLVRATYNGKPRNYRCFLMERAHCTLREYLETELDISLSERIALCRDLIRSVRALHEMDIYHRDIKPENIFLCADGWKIGDLGLVAYRSDDINADAGENKIGPLKWMSPEAINQGYCIIRNGAVPIDTSIDDKSDVFQLGKVCWFILQGDIPNGCLKRRDLVEGVDALFGEFLEPMLGYLRGERPTLEEVEARLMPIGKDYSI